MNGFQKGGIELLATNDVFSIGRELALATAGTSEARAHNMLTIGWATFGVLWGKNVVHIYVRPTRHTINFLDKHEYFTVSWFGEAHREVLKLCGSISGRDEDKTLRAGLSAIPTDNGSTSFAQARLVVEARKIHAQFLDPATFIDPKIETMYPLKDYHCIFTGEITSVYKAL